MMALRTTCSGKGVVPTRRPVTRARKAVMSVRAEASTKPGLAKFADAIGMPTDEGYFGFKPFSEMWVSRWAMIGFLSSIIGEFTTGKGTLGQLGIETPSPFTFAVIATLAGGATLYGTVATVQNVLSKKITRASLERYKNFLGLKNEKDWEEEAKKMKAKPDFATPGNDMAAIEQVRREGMPADRVLAMTGDAAAADAAAAEMKAAEAAGAPVSTATAPRERQVNNLVLDDMAYARDIELTNGRYAMLGFLAAILVECVTGDGILGQIIMYCKLSGLLGADSGF